MVSTKLVFIYVATGAVLSAVHSAPAVPTTSPVLTNKDVCNTPQCNAIADSFIHDMNPDEKPCEDFEKFACGGFYKKMEIEEGYTEISTMLLAEERNNVILQAIVDPSLGKAPKPAPSDTASTNNLKKVHDMWKSCVNTTARGHQPLVDQFNAIIKLIPDVTTSIDKMSLTKTIAAMTKIGVEPFIAVTVETDLFNPDASVIYLSSGGISMSAEDYANATAVTELEQEVALAFQNFLGSPLQFEAPPLMMEYIDQKVLGPALRTRAPLLAIEHIDQKWIAAAKKVVAFEKDIAHAILNSPKSPKTGYEKAYNPWSIDKLKTAFPSIDWNALIAELMPAGQSYTRNFIADSPDIFTNIEAVIKVTPADTFRYYVIYRNIDEYSVHLSNSTRDCVTVIKKSLGQIVGHYFVEQAFPEHTKVAFKAMIDQILASYKEWVPKLDWLDPKTLEGAMKKLNALVAIIGESGSSPDASSSASLEEYYKGFVVDPMDYYGNQYRSTVWMIAKKWEMINKPYDRKSLSFVPQEFDAYYVPNYNQMQFPAGMIQDPYFNPENPDYMNYGAMGTIAGHEMGHGFDTQGKDFDHVGKFTNWWTDDTAKKFSNKTDCIVKQYNNFTITGPNNETVHLLGNATLAENIADNGGMKYGFRAWQSAYNSDPTGTTHKNYKLPKLEKYTPEQMFFLSYARAWCTKMTPQKLLDDITVMADRVLLTRLNAEVDRMIALATGMTPGEAVVYNSEDCSLDEDSPGAGHYTPEILNTPPNGLPP
ncbi:hypothetical protein EC991_002322 [Linnemannia zychae]|nr:hypothetical protein EC991_002322 [Linnemannia zychae]